MLLSALVSQIDKKFVQFVNVQPLLQHLDQYFISANVNIWLAIVEYVSDRLIDEICGEITNEVRLSLFQSHVLIQGTTKDYIRESQVHCILKPIADRLLSNFGSLNAVERQVSWIIHQLAKP